MQYSNKEVAHLLRSVAAVYTIQNKNRFSIIAYEEASDIIDNYTRQIYDIWQNNELEKISGIGKVIASRLDEYFKNSKDNSILKILSRVPGGVFELMKVPGIGPKRAYALSIHFELANPKSAINQLINYAKNNKIAPLDNFGLKSQDQILKACQTYQKRQSKQQRMLISDAYEISCKIINYLRQLPYDIHCDTLGSLRRRVATIGDIDITVICPNDKTQEVIDHFVKYKGAIKIESKGDKKASIILANQRRVDLIVSDKSSYGAMLQYNTGSKSHNIKLREYALKKGFSLSEYGIKKIRDKKNIIPFENEKAFYNYLNLSWIPPEIREGTLEIELAKNKRLPTLVSRKDVKGDLHIHSNFNIEPSHDLGESNIDELIHKAKKLEYLYIMLCDHNPSQKNHTDEQYADILKSRYKMIKQKSSQIKIFVGLEVDILPDGTIAFPKNALAYVDSLTVAIHSRFNQTRSEMTKRILKALSFEKVKILAHPTGRMLQRREEIEADWPQIFSYCAKKGIILEINGQPIRQDLPDTLVYKAKQYNILFSLSTDSHHVEQMNYIDYAISVARRGWLEKNDIINSKSIDEISKILTV